ncbi:hypothetical protein [Photobacterium sanguinicancri]|uniref:Uncharacterized protein n=1 Tax=Photobacterium sanguinicancri TaxID=875932 RepID=A0AAW7Y0S4_9GAMM|nr:hypothetical protein [Photobacterium sanguinicancri]KXI21371.1 hypothetical protein AS132_22610 [Photobacterium sanguinicancri]MDO6542183.1 hypothetical protein [Photobacterium sanguinicancri]OZS41959.1 hypothetical protein ASV53_21000 [Photobacterium sanguinicancri]
MSILALTVNVWVIALTVAPVSMVALVYGMKKKLSWLSVGAVIGLLLSVLLLILSQYTDYKKFEQCLMRGEGYSPFSGLCVKSGQRD